jgi:hypothetical protein
LLAEILRLQAQNKGLIAKFTALWTRNKAAANDSKEYVSTSSDGASKRHGSQSERVIAMVL